MEDAGLDPGDLIVNEISSDAEAEAAAFHGSPTIRVNGRDIDEPGGNPIGLACRVYRRADGSISALPDRDDVRRALRAK